MNEVSTMNNNTKIHVKIGRKYRDAFQSICDLVKFGCINQSIVQSCRDDRIIETDSYVFEYTGDVAAIDTGAQVGMFAGGASWFSVFRGGESDDVAGAWHNLIELVSTSYHREYSLSEYIQDSFIHDDTIVTHYKELITKVADGLHIPISGVLPAAKDDSIEDIYAVSMRLELFSGVGEPRPLLCKIYFRKQNNVFYPIASDEAAVVDEFVSHLVSSQGSGVAEGEENSETNIADTVLNSVSRLITGNLSRSFSESVLVTNPTDIETLDDFASNEPESEVRLECKRLKVLSISHVQWVDTIFDVYMDAKKAFRAKVGLSGAISLYCYCSNENNKLIENNVIVCRSPKTGLTTNITLDLSRADLGLSPEKLEMIQWGSAFADHRFPISCSELSRRRIDCTRYRCKCNTIKFEIDGKVRYKCADCPYPEVVFHHSDGRIVYTPTLRFDTDSLSVTENETDTCNFCGRSYEKSKLSSSFLCDFCDLALHASETGRATAEHRKNYARYACMIPFADRVFSLFAKKYCFENSDRLIFILGKKKYFFDKLGLTDSGMINKPERRK